MRFSFSALSKYAKCPERFRLERVEGEKDASDSVPLYVGSAFHAAIEKLVELSPKASWLDDEAIDEATMVKSLLVAEAVANTPLDSVDAPHFGNQTHDWWMSTGYAMLAENFLNLVPNWRMITRTEIELKHLVTQFDDDSPNSDFTKFMEFICYIDAESNEDGTIVLRDWKTGKRNDEHRIQLDMYGALYSHQTGVPLDNIILEDVYLNSSAQKKAGVKTWNAYRDIDWLNRIIRSFWEAVESEVYPPNGLFLDQCGRCGVRSHCQFVKQPEGGPSNVEF